MKANIDVLQKNDDKEEKAGEGVSQEVIVIFQADGNGGYDSRQGLGEW